MAKRKMSAKQKAALAKGRKSAGAKKVTNRLKGKATKKY